MKEYNLLECGCKYVVDNNEEVIYCKDHTKWDDVKLLIGRDVKERLIKFIHNNL